MKTEAELSDAVYVAGNRVRFAWDKVVKLEDQAGARAYNDARCEYALARCARDHAEEAMAMGSEMRRAELIRTALERGPVERGR